MNDQPSSHAWCVIWLLAGIRLMSSSENVDGLATSPSIISPPVEKAAGDAYERERSDVYRECYKPNESLVAVGEYPDESRATIDQAPSTTNWNITVP